jgi:hypothetical protein
MTATAWSHGPGISPWRLDILDVHNDGFTSTTTCSLTKIINKNISPSPSTNTLGGTANPYQHKEFKTSGGLPMGASMFMNINYVS